MDLDEDNVRQAYSDQDDGQDNTEEGKASLRATLAKPINNLVTALGGVSPISF